MIKAIFWDFDGVIADSFNVKTDAFHEMYLPYGEEIAEKVRQHHLANGGVSRYEKFKIYQAEFLGEPTPIPQKTIDQLSQQFSDLVLNKVVNAPYIPGVVDVLRKYSKIVDNYIISGTPTEEMREIISRRGLSDYFTGVYGSPDTKSVWTQRLMDEHVYKPNEGIFIGDALSDYKAAKATGTFFILRRHEDNRRLFTDYHSYAIDDFFTFDEVFNQINQE